VKNDIACIQLESELYSDLSAAFPSIHSLLEDRPDVDRDINKSESLNDLLLLYYKRV